MAVRVLVADDQRVVREGLALLLDMADDIELVGLAQDGEDAVRLTAEAKPDVVLMDLRMPRVDGVEATRRIRGEHPEVHVVVLTTHADDESVFAALRAGARGYLTKDAGSGEIYDAVRVVAQGRALLDPDVQARLLDEFDRVAAPRRTAVDGLTQRETEILALIGAGLSNAEIAKALVVSEATVKTHINHLFTKSGVRDRAQAVTHAYRLGLVKP
jgi:DNA-binding NarL/FixJ family response regulator